MRTMVLPEQAKDLQLQTIRLQFLKITRKLIHSGRRIILKLIAHHVYHDEFLNILRQRQPLF